MRWICSLCCLWAFAFTAVVTAAPPADAVKTGRGAVKSSQKHAAKQSPPKYTTASIRGKVVWLSEALRRRYGVKVDRDSARTMVALETPRGELIPIMKEARGRGFWIDPRLHGIEMELFVRRYRGIPLVQVIRVYTLKHGKKYAFDYWCDICAIPMFELKPCDCCQGAIRIRKRLVREKPTKKTNRPASE